MVIGVIGHRVKGQVKFSAGVAVVCPKCDQEKDEPHLQDNQMCVFPLSVLFRWKQDGEQKTVGSDFSDKKPANNG